MIFPAVPLLPPQEADSFPACVSRLLGALQEELLQHHAVALDHLSWTRGTRAGCRLPLPSEQPLEPDSYSVSLPKRFEESGSGHSKNIMQDPDRDVEAILEPDAVSPSSRKRVSSGDSLQFDEIEAGVSSMLSCDMVNRVDSAYSAPRTHGASSRGWLCVWPLWSEEDTLRLATPQEETGMRPTASATREQLTKYFTKRDTADIKAGNEVNVVSGDVIAGSSSYIYNRLAMLPNSMRRIVWDLISAFVLAYDVVVIPLQCLFGTLLSKDMQVVGLATNIFWSLDIVASNFTAFHNQSIIEMRFRKILSRYLRTWFVLDVSMVTLDWLLLAFENGEAGLLGTARSARMLRLARMLRVLRLLRVLKVHRFASIEKFVRSESTLILTGIGRLLIGVILANHYIACAWYALGTAGVVIKGDSDNSWVRVIEDRQGQLSVFYWYLASLHWSLTQFTPASMDVVPVNSYERAFTIVVIVFALVVFSSVVSSITSATSALRSLSMQRLQQEELLRRYITEKRVSFQVGSRVYDYIKYKLKRDVRRVHESDVVALKQMPNTLQMQLRCDVYGPLLVVHPVFHHFDLARDGVMEEICHTAMSERTVMPGSEFFTIGTPSTSMCFLFSGSLDYYYKNGKDLDKVTEGDFVCEGVLWLQWLHRGRAVAPVVTDLALVCASRFREAIGRNNRMMRCVQDYARSFAGHYAMQYEARAEVSDLSTVIDRDEVWAMALKSFGSYVSLDDYRPRTSAVSGMTGGVTIMAHKTMGVLKRAQSFTHLPSPMSWTVLRRASGRARPNK